MMIHELVGRFIEVDEALSEMCADKGTLEEALQAINEELKSKFDSYIIALRKYEAQAEALNCEIKRLQERKKIVTQNAKSVKAAILNAMRATDHSKIESDFYTATVRRCPPSLVVDDEMDVPKWFKTKVTEYKVDTKKLKKYLDSVGGETEYAHLEPGFSLNIE